MRKYLIVCLLLLILSGCGTNENFEPLDMEKEEPSPNPSLSFPEMTEVVAQQEKPCNNYYSLFLGDTPQEFMNYLYFNQIDIDMEAEGELLYNTMEINAWVSKYNDIWENEMNAVYENVLEQLSSEAKDKLEESQASWESTMQHHLLLWYDIFDLTKGRGSGDPSMVTLQRISMLKIRTFLLAEYHYWLTGEFDFTYN